MSNRRLSHISKSELKRRIHRKWQTVELKEWWYTKLTAVRRNKLITLSERQGHRCAICQSPTWLPSLGESGPKRHRATLEHVVPVCEGGSDHLHNLLMTCGECNNRRGTMNIYHFHHLVSTGKLGISKSARRILKRIERSKNADRIARQNRRIIEMAYLMTIVPEIGRWVDSYLRNYPTNSG